MQLPITLTLMFVSMLCLVGCTGTNDPATPTEVGVNSTHGPLLPSPTFTSIVQPSAIPTVTIPDAADPPPPTRPPVASPIPITPESAAERATRVAATHIALATEVAIDTTPGAVATRNAQIDARLTLIAQHPTPPTEMPRFDYGLVGAPADFNYEPSHPLYTDAWRGQWRGQIITLAAGRQAETVDLQQGILVFYAGPSFDDQAPSTQVYLTPQRLGQVHIATVGNGRVYLALGNGGDPGDPNETAFVFDLATRQWVNP